MQPGRFPWIPARGPSRPQPAEILLPDQNGVYLRFPVQRPPIRRKRPTRWIHLLLFLLTVVSTTVMVGPLYSVCLMSILTAHEFGHYFAAKYHRVPASLPYFIPFPSMLGTMGAVIRMSGAIPNRRALFDIAAAGPIAGLVVALPVSFVGLYLSDHVTSNSQGMVVLGDPLLLQAMQWLIHGPLPDNVDLMLHPVAFAGWVGLFVTALNLLPIGQLDGGHINHALFGRHSQRVALAAFAVLAVMTFMYGYHYTLILFLLLFMGVKHPPTMNDFLELGPVRRRIGFGLWIVFALCFTPAPLKF